MEKITKSGNSPIKSHMEVCEKCKSAYTDWLSQTKPDNEALANKMCDIGRQLYRVMMKK